MLPKRESEERVSASDACGVAKLIGEGKQDRQGSCHRWPELAIKEYFDSKCSHPTNSDRDTAHDHYLGLQLPDCTTLPWPEERPSGGNEAFPSLNRFHWNSLKIFHLK